MTRPSNWYRMEAWERQAWEKSQKDLENLQYERDLLEREKERAAKREKEVRQTLRSEVESAQEERLRLHANIMELEERLELVEKWLGERGLLEDCLSWVDEQTAEETS